MSSVFPSVCMGQCSYYGKKKQVVFLIPEEQGTKILHFKISSIICLLVSRKTILGVWSAVWHWKQDFLNIHFLFLKPQLNDDCKD